MKSICDPELAVAWPADQKAEFVRWYEASRFASKVPGATACYELVK